MRWYADTIGDVIRDESGSLVAQFFTSPSPEELALMCAAPEMLEALRYVWNKAITEYYTEDSPLRQKVEAAIAKAEGRS